MHMAIQDVGRSIHACDAGPGGQEDTRDGFIGQSLVAKYVDANDKPCVQAKSMA